MAVGNQCTLDNLDELPLSYVSKAKIINFSLDNGNLATLPFDKCSGFVLFEFMNQYSQYDNNFLSQNVKKPILTTEGIYVNNYSIAPGILDHKPTDKLVYYIHDSEIEYSDITEVLMTWMLGHWQLSRTPALSLEKQIFNRINYELALILIPCNSVVADM